MKKRNSKQERRAPAVGYPRAMLMKIVDKAMKAAPGPWQILKGRTSGDWQRLLSSIRAV